MANTVLRDHNFNKVFKMPVNTGTTISAGELVKDNGSDQAVAVSSSGDTVIGVVLDGIDENNDSKFDQYITLANEAVIEASAINDFSFGDAALYNGTGMISSGTTDVLSTGQTNSYIKAVEPISAGNTGKFLVDTTI